jgi:hypothetical protein
MNKNIKYIIYFFIGIIIYYLLFNDNRLVEGNCDCLNGGIPTDAEAAADQCQCTCTIGFSGVHCGTDDRKCWSGENKFDDTMTCNELQVVPGSINCNHTENELVKSKCCVKCPEHCTNDGAPIEADITGNQGHPDDTVNVQDLLELLGQFGQEDVANLTADIASGDIASGDPNDGVVNVSDLLALLAAFGAEIPEDCRAKGSLVSAESGSSECKSCISPILSTVGNTNADAKAKEILETCCGQGKHCGILGAAGKCENINCPADKITKGPETNGSNVLNCCDTVCKASVCGPGFTPKKELATTPGTTVGECCDVTGANDNDNDNDNDNCSDWPCTAGTILKSSPETIKEKSNELCCDLVTCTSYAESNCSGTFSELKDNASSISCSGTECTKEECCEEEDNTVIIGLIIFFICFCIIIIIIMFFYFSDEVKVQGEVEGEVDVEVEGINEE